MRGLGNATPNGDFDYSFDIEDDDFIKYCRKTRTGRPTMKKLISWHKLNIFKRNFKNFK